MAEFMAVVMTLVAVAALVYANQLLALNDSLKRQAATWKQAAKAQRYATRVWREVAECRRGR